MAVNKSRPTKLWWLLGLVLFCLCLVVQLPTRWLVQKFYPNNPYLQQVSGNLWQGQANWQIMPTPNTPMAGTLNWQWQPWHLITGKMALAITIETGKTELKGQVKLGKNNWQINDMTGKISTDTLRLLSQWKLPDAPITIQKLSLAYTTTGFQQVAGELAWAGGELGYPTGGRIYQINLPSIKGILSQEQQTNKGQNNPNPRLHLALTDQKGQRLGDLYIDNDKMLDVALTQRLLKNMPDYQGKGADDTVVVSLRQPLSSLGK